MTDLPRPRPGVPLALKGTLQVAAKDEIAYSRNKVFWGTEVLIITISSSFIILKWPAMAG